MAGELVLFSLAKSVLRSPTLVVQAPTVVAVADVQQPGCCEDFKDGRPSPPSNWKVALYYLGGGWVSTPLKNMNDSQIGSFPEGSGWK